MSKGNLLLIVNPCSGRGKSKKVSPKILRAFEDAQYNVTMKYTQKTGDATNFAAEQGYDVVVAVGGDGTLNETISGIVGSGRKDVSLGYIPMGSTNDFARSMGLPSCWRRAVKVVIEGEEKEIDVCRFNDRFFAYVAAHGIFAETSCSVSQRLKNKLGHFAYVLLGVKEVFRKNNYPIKIEVDGEIIDDTYAFLGFGNTKSIGGILKFKDEYVEMSDGLFEVLLVKYPKNLWQLSRMIKRFNRSEWQGDGLEMRHAKSVRLYTDQDMIWSLDGEKYVVGHDSVIENLPKAIKLRVK